MLLPKLLVACLVFMIFSASLQARESGSISGTITNLETGEPLGGVYLTLLGTGRGAISTAAGSYRINLSPGLYTLRASLLGYRPEEKEIRVTAGEESIVNFALEQSVIQFGEVAVTLGSRTERIAVETAVPIDVIGAQSIEESGYANLSQVLQFLAPSFNSSPQTVSDGTDHIDPASLRGLGPDQVLVLINGKRRHSSALVNVNGTVGRGSVGTDFNAIPTAAIERIEILRDGASAQYGSDAIAGVINVQLKTQTDEISVDLMSGITGEGDGETIRFNSNYGIPIGEFGYFNVTAEYRDRQPTNRAGTYTGPVYSQDEAEDEALIAERGFDREAMKIGSAKSLNAGLFFNSSLPISDEADIYAFGGTNFRSGRGFGFYRYPFEEAKVNLGIYPDGFLPEIHTLIRDNAITVGVDGLNDDWISDLSITHGSNAFAYKVRNSLNASLGADSPLEFDAGSLNFSQTSVNLDVITFVMPEGFLIPLSVALGAEFRVENYRIEAGEEASYLLGTDTTSTGDPKFPGAQVFPGFQPSNEVDEYRSNAAFFLDLESDIADDLLLNLAGRFENYSDFGSNVSAKLAGRWSMMEALALRAAFSTGFRAPSLHQLYFNNISTQFVEDEDTGDLVARQVLTSNNSSPVTRSFGIPDLKEEQSLNFSAGISSRPLENLSLTIDFYRIDIEDRIVLSGRFSRNDPTVAALLEPFSGVSAAQFFTNAVDTKTQGVDIVLSYGVELGGGDLELTAAANLTETEIDGAVKTSAELQGLEETLFNREERSRLELAQPGLKSSLGARYQIDDFTARARLSYFGEIDYVHPTLPANDQTFSAQSLLDVELAYALTRGLKLRLGGNNIFNVFPDENIPANTSSGRFVYSRRVTQFGFNGGFYYAGLDVRL